MIFVPLAAFEAADQAAIPDGIAFVKELQGMREYKLLANDLSILLRRDSSAPVVTFMVTYRVGSRNEATGYTGATHLLEHMMFKGTPTHNKEKGTQIAATLQRVGALLNATTWLDRTNYFEVLPSDELELAMKIEADRMRNSMIRDEDRQSEMTVVRNEFDIGDNRPERVLRERLFAHAYIAHPYHHPTIGWRSDIEGVSTQKLKEFYDTYYWPNNATVSIIGDFAEAKVFGLLKKYFAKIPRSPHEIPRVYTREPAQQGEVRFKIRRAGQLGILAVAHKTPEALHADMPALDLLSAILSVGKTSRFYREIVDRKLGVSQMTNVYQLRDPALMVTQVILSPGVAPADVETVILRNYQRVIDDGVTDRELDIARNQLIADIAYDRDGSYAYASRLNEAIASANWENYVTYIDRLRALSKADIQRAARTYFVEENRVVGVFEPLGGPAMPVSDEGLDEPQPYSSPGGVLPGASPAVFPGMKPAAGSGMAYTNRVRTATAANGARCLLLRTGVEGVISLRGVIRAGAYFAPRDKPLVARLTAAMLDHGTQRRNKFELAEALEQIGAELSFVGGRLNMRFSGRCLSEHAEPVIALLVEMLREPGFAPAEFEKVRAQEVARIRKKLESTNARAENLLNARLFPPDHPYFTRPIEKQLEQLETITLDDVAEFYTRTYGGEHLLFTAVGDLDVEEIAGMFERAFGDWQGGGPIPELPRLKIGDPDEIFADMPDKPNIDMYFAHTGMPRPSDEEYRALVIANEILGNSPLSSRLGISVRDTQGLTYSIYSFLSTSNHADGTWGVSMAVSPDDLQKARAAVRSEVEKFIEQGVSGEEVEREKQTMVGKYKVYNGLNSGSLANQLLYVIDENLGLEYMDSYEERVMATTPEQVNAAIRKYMHPENWVVSYAGGLPR